MLAGIPLGRFAGTTINTHMTKSSHCCLLIFYWSFKIHFFPTEVEEVVDAVIFLLSDRASMIHGTTLPIDGGFLAC